MRKITIIMVLFGGLLCVKAQTGVGYFHYPKKLDSIVGLTDAQKKDLRSIIKEKSEGYKTASNHELKRQINNNYCKKVYALLGEEKSELFINAITDKASIIKNADVLYNKHFKHLHVPEDYKPLLKEVLTSFEYTGAKTNHKRFIYDEVTLLEKQRTLFAEKMDFIHGNTKNLQKAEFSWNTMSNRLGALNEAFKAPFIAYQFYVYMQASATVNNTKITEFITEHLSAINTTPLIEAMAENKAKFTCESSGFITKQEPALIKTIQETLKEKFLGQLEAKRTAQTSLFESNTSQLLSYNEVKTIVDTELESYKTKQKEQAYKSITEKAKTAGLNNKTIKELIVLLKQKEADVAAIKQGNQDAGSTGLFGISTQKSMGDVKKEFSKAVANLLSRKEYAAILGEDLRPFAIKNAEKEVQQVLQSYSKLTQEQQTAVQQRIELYYFNEAVVKHYYSYDWHLQKQKLSGLRYYFEKDFKVLMDSFDVKIKNGKKANNNSFQY